MPPLPPDGHVHSQFSWDARRIGSMADTCRRAVELGLPSVAFTEHVDLAPFRAGSLVEPFPDLVADGVLAAPLPDLEAYFAELERCRRTFPELVVLSGVEVGQPHRHVQQVRALLAQGSFDRVVGSLHCLPDGDAVAEPFTLFDTRPAAEVFSDYLAEVPRMVAGSDVFATLAHWDYPVRSWPRDAGPFDARDFEDGIRAALRAVAEGGRALEINTRLPLDPLVLRWWREAGGGSVTFGSDAHEAPLVGTRLADAGRLADSLGYAPGDGPAAPWRLRR